MSYFTSVRHNLYVGWVVGKAMSLGIPVAPMTDAEGNFTNRVLLTLGDRPVVLTVEEPAEDWQPDDEFVAAECPSCRARARLKARCWWETEHDPSCRWLADPNAEPYA